MTASEGDGNGWVVSAGGDRRWGRFGAAGLLLRAADPTDPDTPLADHDVAGHNIELHDSDMPALSHALRSEAGEGDDDEEGEEDEEDEGDEEGDEEDEGDEEGDEEGEGEDDRDGSELNGGFPC